MSNASNFYKKVRLARLEARLKQDQVARYLKIPVSAVSAFESGNRKVDAIELYKLSKLYNRPLSWFFGEETKNDTHTKTAKIPSYQFEDPVVQECILLIQSVPKKLQRSAAYGVIGFLSER